MRNVKILLVATVWLSLSALHLQAQEKVVIRYRHWAAPHLTVYEQCALMFEAEHPTIDIQLEHVGWGSYWTDLQTGFVNSTAPDVFVNHVTRYPELVMLDRVLDLQPLVERDSLPMDIYLSQITEMWMHDGARYGLPKDWDTTVVVYNRDLFEAANIDPAVMQSWTWNPDDGGTFESIIAQLTRDANGNNGLNSNFDPNNVLQYGFIHSGDGNFTGQRAWSHWAASNGFRYTDGTWGGTYQFDDPALIDTLQWLADLHLTKGYAPPLADVERLGPQALFQAGVGAMMMDNSESLGSYFANAPFRIGFAPVPIGPQGRKTPLNGLGDSIWSGTPHLEEAWAWVKFLASPDCQNMVGDTGIVFPALLEATERTVAFFERQNVDVSVYVMQAMDADGTFWLPINDHASEVSPIMTNAIRQILSGERPAREALTEANVLVNSLFQ